MNTVISLTGPAKIQAIKQHKLGVFPRILMIEENSDSLRINAEFLIRDGYEVIAEKGWFTGWKTLLATRFDLVIIDNNMTSLTGLELVKKMRRTHIHLPVILTSRTLHVEELKLHLWIQLAATLLKPFTYNQLLETVKTVLRNTGGCVFVKRRVNYQHWGINE